MSFDPLLEAVASAGRGARRCARAPGWIPGAVARLHARCQQRGAWGVAPCPLCSCGQQPSSKAGSGRGMRSVISSHVLVCSPPCGRSSRSRAAAIGAAPDMYPTRVAAGACAGFGPVREAVGQARAAAPPHVLRDCVARAGPRACCAAGQCVQCRMVWSVGVLRPHPGFSCSGSRLGVAYGRGLLRAWHVLHCVSSSRAFDDC